MKKSFLIGLVGIFVTVIVIVSVASLAQLLFPSPVVLSSLDKVNAVKFVFINSSISLLMGKLLAGMLGGIANGFVTAKMNGNKTTATIVGGLFSTLAGYYMYLVVNPVWFWTLLIICFIPCSLFGYLAGSRNKEP